ncbi:hypothetical protein [Stutzerimonas stutzeri]|uniref:hypothetical protein n=1 Tax=Stutzerimonas stutzeri TaxID=316 RepID=UPI00210B3FF9|nr:hypothetical protein [Stutzerimonas stutzeri]MCQ4322884.1 hypothetical protein [Stutzerimonas stutzeri]
MTTANAMPQSFGMFSKKVSSAFRPPADAPIPTTGNLSVLRVRLLFLGVDGSGLLLIDSSAFWIHMPFGRQLKGRQRDSERIPLTTGWGCRADDKGWWGRLLSEKNFNIR